MSLQMVRKGIINHKSEQYHRSEYAGRICKTPRIVLERLNIPLDSVVLVRGDSLIYPLDSTTNQHSQLSNIIDITVSDDDSSEDVNFHEIMVKRFQSTKDNGNYGKSDSCNPTPKLDYTETSPAKLVSHSVTVSKPGPKSKKNAFYQSKILKKKMTTMAGNIGSTSKFEAQRKQFFMKNATKKPLDSENAERHIEMKIESAGFFNVSCTKEDLVIKDKKSLSLCETETSAVKNTESHRNTSPDVSKNDSDIVSVLIQSESESDENSVRTSKSYHTITEKKIDKNIAELSTTIENSSIADGENRSNVGAPTNFNENQNDFTPSRISQRIKNKKVKFSALQLLAGGDLYTLRKELLASNVKKTSTPKKSVVKTKAGNTADINENNSLLSPENARETSIVKTLEKGKIISTIKSLTPERKNCSEASDQTNQVNEDKVKNSENKKISPKKQKKLSINKPKDSSLNTTKQMLTLNEQNNENSTAKGRKSTDDSILPNDKQGKQGKGLVENKIYESREIIPQKPSTSIESTVKIKKVSSKIRLELQGAPSKKVVNISISPMKEQLKTQEVRKDNLKEKLDVELGPDIVIRRIKSNKTVVLPFEGKIAAPRSGQEDVGNENSVSIASNKSNNLVVKNLIYPEKSAKSGVQASKEVEVPPQIKKLLLEAVKSKKPVNCKNESLDTKIHTTAGDNSDEAVTNGKKKKKSGELIKKKSGQKDQMGKQKFQKIKNSDERDTDWEMSQDEDTIEVNQSEIQIISSTLEEDESLNNGDGSKERSDLRKSPKITVKPWETKRNSKEETFTKVGGKKTAKVTPLRQVTKVQPKSEIVKKTFSDKVKVTSEKEKECLKFPKSKIVPRLSSTSELTFIGSKRNYSNAFEKYFICTEKICEHNDSVDSDSDCEDTNLLSHFVDLNRRNKGNKQGNNEVEGQCDHLTEDANVKENISEQMNVNNVEKTNFSGSGNEVDNERFAVNEVIKGITADLPKWNCHIIPENSVICLILLERESNGIYDIKKCIEIDYNFKTNVYVDKALVSEYCGVYDNYDAIKNLIYQVELL